MAQFTMELNKVIENNNIFDFDYTLSTKIEKDKLQQAFINHYFYREIGQETIERFKHFLKTQWLETLELYNNMWDIEQDKGNDILATSKSQQDNRQIVNETPDTEIDFNSSYASNIMQSSTKLSISDNQQMSLMRKYQKSFVDIQVEFINSFDNLFMQIF